jgi:hypothetical protein
MPDTGKQHDTPTIDPPKDPGLKTIYDNAVKGDYLRDLDKSINEYGGSELKKKWNDKRK